MKKRMPRSNRLLLESFVINAAHRCGVELISFSKADKWKASMRLQELLVWFSADRPAILAAARAGTRYLREMRKKWAAERAAKLKEAA